MAIAASLLSAWMMLQVSAPQVDEFKTLASNDPQQALQVYPKLLEQALNPEIKVAVHYEALLGAMNAGEWEVYVNIVKSLKEPKLFNLTQTYAFKLLTRIGVAYRLNYQLQQAKYHYKCALDKSGSDIEHTLLKVNLAIVYRLLEQPAMAFQLIDSIDVEQLSTKVRAGYFVVRGNILEALGEFDKALNSFEQAYHQYIKLNNQRAQIGVMYNIMGSALANKRLDQFSQYRVGFKEKVREYHANSSDYLQWLDTIAAIQKTEKMSAEQEKWLRDNARQFTLRGYKADIKAHLMTINAEHLYSEAPFSEANKNTLPELLGKVWCT